MEVLEKIRQFAEEAHGEQKRKYSQLPYIVHPVAVMNLCREYTDEVPALAAALLHDVLEDTPVTAHQLHAYLLSVMNRPEADRTLRLVKDLTDEYTKANYPQLNRKKRRRREAERLASADPMAQTVKYADLIDNCLDIVKHDKDFGKVFVQESTLLLEHMTSGDQRLYQRACNAVAESKKVLRGYKDNQPEVNA
ncbi:HD domain-containing protein [Telluribacter sp.]|jgi:(p)ppGpp synthase/HD superfamily hydrolase|uniref:HD domain-containing protein n=1 Tax=Telluribacter sp. TaxID=1978767 RepID=UPI002E0E9F5F|nr:HD domain-containing protein [Telluribacter sp.]